MGAHRAADLGARAGWRGGVLPEAKFRHFRLDRMVASYHPRRLGVEARASPLFVATAARLAELAPVALWKFDDEVRARR